MDHCCLGRASYHISTPGLSIINVMYLGWQAKPPNHLAKTDRHRVTITSPARSHPCQHHQGRERMSYPPNLLWHAESPSNILPCEEEAVAGSSASGRVTGT